MITERDGAVTFDVKVRPRASRDAVLGMEGERIRIVLRAAPVDGKANEALVRFLAETLGVPRRSVEIVRGEKGGLKTVRVAGVRREAVERLVDEPG